MGVLSRTFQILSVVVLLIAILIGGYIYDRKYLPHDANFQGSPELSYPLQLFSWVLETFFADSIRVVSVEQLLDEAKAKTGLNDFDWERDPNAYEGLRLTIEDVITLSEQDAFTGFGLFNARSWILDSLIARLRVVDSLKRHAHELKPVQEPLIIVGLPRTGTSFLLNVLSQDPQFRILTLYESREPAVSLEVERGEEPDNRLRDTRIASGMIQTLYPQISAIHNHIPDGAEECVDLMKTSFQLLFPPFFYDSPKYSEWVVGRYFPGIYPYYHDQLQILQLENPKARWLLKSPVHLQDIGSLFSEIPSAKVVWNHRKPDRSFASMASLTAHVRSLFLREVDPEKAMDFSENLLTFYLNNSTLTREKFPDMAIVDISYENLISEPLKTVAHIYKAHNIPFTKEAEENMRNYLQQNPQHKHGKHIYQQFARPLDIVQEKCPVYFEKYARYFQRFEYTD